MLSNLFFLMRSSLSSFFFFFTKDFPSFYMQEHVFIEPSLANAAKFMFSSGSKFLCENCFHVRHQYSRTLFCSILRATLYCY